MSEDAITDHGMVRDRLYADPGKLAARQRLWGNRSGPPSAQVRLDLLELTGNETVLDVGCGNGPYLAELRRRGHRGHVLGADLSIGMARAAAPNATGTVVADAAHLPVADATVDAALAMHMLYHVPELPAAIAELRRVVRPGGALLVSTNGSRHIREIATVMDVAARTATGRERVRPHFSFTLETGEALLAAAFADVRCREDREVVRIDSVEPVVDYIASMEPEHCGVRPGTQWSAFLAAATELVAARIRLHGAFNVTSHTGTFVCRRA